MQYIADIIGRILAGIWIVMVIAGALLLYGAYRLYRRLK